MGCIASVPAFDDGCSAAHQPTPNLPSPAAVRPITEGELFAATAGFSAHRLLGEGGFGRVYQGVWADGTSVAVKVLDAGASAFLQGPREFDVEVVVLSACAGHRHIVPLLGVCSEPGGVLASVLAHAAGGSLRSALSEEGRPFTWAARLGAAAGAAAGLAHLHALGWAHGDVSSGNVLLAASGEAWLSDFGLARWVGGGGGGGGEAGAEEGEAAPTPPRGAWAYLAPELLVGGGGRGGGDPAPAPAPATSTPTPDGRATHPADVWALGVVFLELLTGEGAGGRAPLAGRLRQALEGGSLLSRLDPRLFKPTGEGPPALQAAALAEAIEGCLSLDPTARPTAAAVALYLAKAVSSGGGRGDGDGGGCVRRAGDVAASPIRPVASHSLMDAVTALDGGDPSGNPFV
jgi:serine/threonine protein kinase